MRKESPLADSQGLAIVRAAQEEIRPLLPRVLAHAAEELPHTPSVNKAEPGATPLGQVVCQVMRDEVGGDVALLQGRALRGPIAQGALTEEHLHGLIPKGNRIMRMEMTEAELRELLEAVLSGRGNVVKAGDSVQFRGISVTHDAARPEG